MTSVPSSPIFTQSPRKPSPVFYNHANVCPPAQGLFSSLPLPIKQIRSNGACEDVVGGPSVVPMAVPTRKRPARIDIPLANVAFSNGEKPELDLWSEVEVEREGYSVYCKTGKRGTGLMEDRFSVILGLEGDPNQALFCVFDGHGGPGAAEFSANNLAKNVMNEVHKRTGEMIESTVKKAYLRTDDDFLKEDIRGGTCCVTALMYRGNIVVSNIGDCRAVMSRNGVAEALTVDHRPSRDDERDRIRNLGGYVDCRQGVWRVYGSLAVSRAIGDSHLKDWVIAEPESNVVELEQDCEFLILASDGLWDYVRNQEAVDVVRSLCIDLDKPEVLSACKKLVDLSLARGSTDDITVMVIQLTHFV